MKTAAAHLANLDLNLLVVLRELIHERNVTRAAERIGITQPAASAALSRLRRHFEDDLLVRGKGGYRLSPLATQLADQVELACATVERIFATSARFDPATSTREFSLLMADYAIAVLGERLSGLMNAVAPQARLHVMLVKAALDADAVEGFRFIDGLIAPPMNRFEMPGIRSTELFRDRWVCVVSADNSLVDGDTLTLPDLAKLSWVAPFYRGVGSPSAAPVTRQLSILGIRPNVAVRVESYQAVPYFVAGTDRIALLQERLASTVADRLGLRVLACPGDPEPIVEMLWWHERHEGDPAHAWFRDVLVRAGHAADHKSN